MTRRCNNAEDREKNAQGHLEFSEIARNTDNDPGIFNRSMETWRKKAGEQIYWPPHCSSDISQVRSGQTVPCNLSPR